MPTDFFITFATLAKYFLFGRLALTVIAVLCLNFVRVFSERHEFVNAVDELQTVKISEILTSVVVVTVVWKHVGYVQSNELILIIFVEWALRKFGVRHLKWQ